MKNNLTRTGPLLLITLILTACNGSENKSISEKRSPGNSVKITAERPPMGWNSFDCFGASVTGEEVKGNAGFMAAHLKEYGWEYIVIDYCWFFPYTAAMGNPAQNENLNPALAMDKYGRLLPAPDKFPSSAGGKGFKPIADYVHSLGLKFGIHVMRGIPRQAVAQNTPVKGTGFKADDIHDPGSVCNWLNAMYGIDMNKAGAQEYYNSLIDLYASWGVDYIKVDDISGPYIYYEKEIEALRKAIDRSGREIVMSLSPGETPLAKAGHVAKNANLWRISNDFWDSWPTLKKQFELCAPWAQYAGPGHWPDADMLPLGRLNRRGPGRDPERLTKFTHEEQKTLVSMWSIFRSPLMIGGDLMVMDKQTITLLTNREVLDVNQNSSNNKQLSRDADRVAWIADVPGKSDKYLAFFNLGESADSLKINLDSLGFSSGVLIRDLWARKDDGAARGTFTRLIAPHGSGLYKLIIK